MDVWRLDSSRVLVTRSCGDFNKFCLISCGTRECSEAMTAEEIFAHLVKGKNRLQAYYKFEFNLRAKFKEELPNFQNFAGLWVHSEEITDPKLVGIHSGTFTDY